MFDPAQEGWKPRDLPGFFGMIGPLWTRKEDAAWAYAMQVEERHLNRAGIAHGGLLGALLDQALSTIAWEACAKRPCITIALDTQFLAPAQLGDLIVARGTVTRRTSSLAFAHGAVTARNETLATASAIFRIK